MEGDWKLIHYHEDERDELYNLARDIGEQNDLIEKEINRARQMRRNWIHGLSKPRPNSPNSILDLIPPKEKPVGKT